MDRGMDSTLMNIRMTKLEFWEHTIRKIGRLILEQSQERVESDGVKRAVITVYS
jgi:hypothetical protein